MTEKLAEAGRCSKSIWKIINDIRGRKTNNINANLTADDINDYYINVPDKILNSLKSTTNTLASTDFVTLLNNIPNNDSVSFSFQPVTYNEIRDIINSLKSKKSRDIYGFTTEILKTIKDLIIVPLTKIINICIDACVFPDVLKTALVIPVFKKGDTEMVENYRPISLLPVFSKIFEAALKTRIVSYFEANKLFSTSQYGFRGGLSTTDAITEFVESAIECFEDGEYLMTTFCDLSKAFDCVKHCFLIEKLKKYNFDTGSLKLIESYFENRSQVVSFNNHTSDKRHITVGVAQGSILGAVFFLIYINDFPSSVKSASVINYADDTTLLSRGPSYADAARLCAEARVSAEAWFKSNMLCLNPDKTTMSLFTLRRGFDNFADSPVKFLGVHLDRTLTWNRHIEMTCKRLSGSIFGLRVLSTSVSTDMLRTAYHALCQPIMTYSLLNWGGAASWRDVFCLQRRAVRIIDKLQYRDDCRDSFSTLRILTFPCLYILECVLFVRKM